MWVKNTRKVRIDNYEVFQDFIEKKTLKKEETSHYILSDNLRRKDIEVRRFPHTMGKNWSTKDTSSEDMLIQISQVIDKFNQLRLFRRNHSKHYSDTSETYSLHNHSASCFLSSLGILKMNWYFKNNDR